MSELKQFKLPDVGEGLTEADIVKWHVQPGDRVTVNQIIVEIETAKAVVELPSPFEGVVAGLLVPEGATVDVGTPIISVDVSPDAGTADADQGAAAAAGTPARGPDPVAAGRRPRSSPACTAARRRRQERQAVLVGYGVKLGTTARRTRKPAAQRSGPAAGAAGAATAAQQPGTAPARQVTQSSTGNNAGNLGQPPANRERPAVLAKPPVRKLARDSALTCPRWPAPARTARSPVTTCCPRPAAPVPTATGPTATWPAATAPPVPPRRRIAPVTAVSREERIPIRGVRKHTAAAVTASAFTAPHVTEFLQIDMTETMAAADRLKSLPDFAGVRVSPLLLRGQGTAGRGGPAADDQFLLGRGRPGDRGPALRQPRHRRGHRARPDRAEHQGCPGADAAGPGPGAERPRRHGPGREGHRRPTWAAAPSPSPTWASSAWIRALPS